MRFFNSVSMGALIAMSVASCETTPDPSDADGPKIFVSDGQGAGYVATSDPSLDLRNCPDGSDATVDEIGWPSRVYPITGAGPTELSVLATDRSGIKKIRIQLDQSSSVSNISPAGAVFSNDEAYTHGTSTYYADFITLDVSSETPLTARSIDFKYAAPVPGILYVAATDFNDNESLISFAAASASTACD